MCLAIKIGLFHGEKNRFKQRCLGNLPDFGGRSSKPYRARGHARARAHAPCPRPVVVPTPRATLRWRFSAPLKENTKPFGTS